MTSGSLPGFIRNLHNFYSPIFPKVMACCALTVINAEAATNGLIFARKTAARFTKAQRILPTSFSHAINTAVREVRDELR